MKTMWLAAVALLGCGCSGPDPYSVEGLMQTLREGDAGARCSAVDSLRNYGAEAKPAVALLTEALQDQDACVRVTAAYALAAIGPDAETALPRLIESLKAKDADLRLAAAYAIP